MARTANGLPDTVDAVELVAEVRALFESLDSTPVNSFLRLWPEAVVAKRATMPSALPVLHWLPEVGGPDNGAIGRVVRHLQSVNAMLDWRQTYNMADFGAHFLERYGWTELIGARGPVAHDKLACGFLLLGPDIEYPGHKHEAEEIYVVLSGTALWRCAEQCWSERRPGTVIHHASNVPHAMRTRDEPLLALYLWKGGDLTQKSATVR